MITFEQEPRSIVRIGVLGIGGAGISITNHIAESNIQGIEIIAADTDLSGLQKSKAPIKFEIGIRARKGTGCIGNPKLGQNAALEEAERIMELLNDFDMILLVGGEGGGTFTGAAPVLAGIASQMGILTIAIATMPFDIQGRERRAKSEVGLHDLKDAVDAILVVESESLFQFLDQDTSLEKALHYMNDIICRAVLGLSEISLKPGVIPLEIADLRAVLQRSNLVLLGTGTGEGPDRAAQATQSALLNPLIGEARISEAKTVMLNVVGSRDNLRLHDTRVAAAYIKEKGSFEQVIVGAMYDENMGERLRVTVIASDADGSVALSEQAPNGSLFRESPVKESIPVEQECDEDNAGTEWHWDRVDRPAFERYPIGRQNGVGTQKAKFNR